jgi:hypothetical protein
LGFVGFVWMVWGVGGHFHNTHRSPRLSSIRVHPSSEQLWGVYSLSDFGVLIGSGVGVCGFRLDGLGLGGIFTTHIDHEPFRPFGDD